MFKIAASPTFWADIKGDLADENGRRVPFAFRAKFKRLPADEIKLMREQAQANNQVDSDVVGDVCVDLDGVGDENGEKMEFAEALQKLIDLGIATPMMSAFINSAPKSRAKN